MLLKATTGSLWAAAIAGINPLIRVSPIDTAITNNAKCQGSIISVPSLTKILIIGIMTFTEQFIIVLNTLNNYKFERMGCNMNNKDCKKPGTFIGVEQKQNVGIDPNSSF